MKLNTVVQWLIRHIRKANAAEMNEIARLRKLLWEIADNQPWALMDREKSPELSNFVLDTCAKARTGIYPKQEQPKE